MTRWHPDQGGGYIIEDPAPMEPIRTEDENGRIVYELEKSSRLDKELATVHARYRIPDDHEQELARLIFAYEKNRGIFENSFARWKGKRGKDAYDAEYLIQEELLDMEAVRLCLADYDLAAVNLNAFLSKFPARDEKKRMPAWKRDIATPPPNQRR